MLGLQYKKMDAFASGGSTGNPAGLVYLSHPNQITGEEMQAIAREEKGIVSEVVFCAPVNSNYYVLKYYSSECEVEFCGHATIACMYDLIKNDPALTNIDTLMINTARGELPVINAIRQSDSVFITAPVPQYSACKASGKDIADHLGITSDEISADWAVEIINAGLDTLIVPIRSLDSILNIKPNEENLKDFCIDNHVDIVLVFSPEVFNKTNAYRTRVFPPKFGYLEDPATGSGNAAFAYYLLNHGMWDGSAILSLEQGPDRELPNLVKIGTHYTDGRQRVIFGGKATVDYERYI